MTSVLDIGIELPLNSATKTFGVLAKRGAGKTYTAGVMAEEFFKAGIPFVVFDPIDVWWGLRLDKTGKKEGLPIVVFGVEHADIELTRDMGIPIARAICKDNVSCVISTFGMPKIAQRHLITEFSEELLRINNTPRHIFIEEAHEFIPQRVWGGLTTCFNAVNNLVVMGRNRGIGITLINQRASTLNKDALTQIDTLIALRNVAPQDRKALRDWVEAHSAEEDFEKFMRTLPSLPTGKAWVWSPEFLRIFKLVQIRHKHTFHPDREKMEGGRIPILPVTQTDVQKFIADFSKGEEVLIEKAQKLPPLLEDSVTVVSLQADLCKQRNTYESTLIEKERQIQALQGKLSRIIEIVGGVPTTNFSNQGNTDLIPMWATKLGSGGVRRIFDFLVSKRGLKFTRSQIGLATKLSSNSGSFATYLATLKRNNLVLERDGLVYLNPDL